MKLFKKSAVIVLAALMLVSLFAFAGCTEKAPEEATYTFSVELPDGSPAVGAGVVVCKGDACDSPLFIDSTGKVSVTKPAANYTVHVINLPAGYKCDDEYTTGLKDMHITFKCVSTVKTPTSGDGSMWNRFEVTKGSYAVKFNSAETTELFYSFFPEESGIFAVYSTGNCDPAVRQYSASSQTCYPTEELNDDRSTTDKNFYLKFEVTDDYIYQIDTNGNKTVNENLRETFGITVKTDSYPVEFLIHFERIGDYVPYTTNNFNVRANGYQKYADADSSLSLTPVPYLTEIYYNDSDNYYHAYSENGPVLVAQFANGTRFNSDASFMDMQAAGESFSYGKIDEENRTINYYNYTEFMATDISGKLNSDGVYPVNQDIYNLLHYFADKNGSWLEGGRL